MAWRCFMDARMRVNQASDILTITPCRVIVKRGSSLFTNPKGSHMESCRPKLPLAARPLIGALEAERVGILFKGLAHPTRLRLLHALIRVDELSVGDLADESGMSVQAVSNQLQRLAEIGVVGKRRNGLQAIYCVIDPCVPVLLERAWCHVDEYVEADFTSADQRDIR